jgi:hypothetical protein
LHSSIALFYSSTSLYLSIFCCHRTNMLQGRTNKKTNVTKDKNMHFNPLAIYQMKWSCMFSHLRQKYPWIAATRCNLPWRVYFHSFLVEIWLPMTGYSWESCWEGTGTVERRTFWNYVVAALYSKTHHQEEFVHFVYIRMNEPGYFWMYGMVIASRHLSFAWLGADLKIGTPTALYLLESYFLLLIRWVMEEYPAELRNGHYLPQKWRILLCMHMHHHFNKNHEHVK